MTEVDYIVVGCGLAGVAFCEQLRKADQSFVVFDDDSQKSSSVAAGIYNPVVLKRFTQVWKAKAQLELAMPYYHDLENLLEVKLNHKLNVYRKFASIEEQNEWFVASDKPVLCDFMHSEILKNDQKELIAPYGFGKVLHSGRIDTRLLMERYRLFLKSTHRLKEERFQYDLLSPVNDGVVYASIKAKHIVFTEGFGLKENPLLPNSPIVGLKGEMLIVKAPTLKLEVILKSSVFVVPLGEDLYWVGATYEHQDKTHNISEAAKVQLVLKLKTLLNCEFEVVQQVAGIRPTTKDRRPLVGSHPSMANVYILNGMGTRGVMISPYVAQQLYDYIEYQTDLDPEINLKRFKAFR